MISSVEFVRILADTRFELLPNWTIWLDHQPDWGARDDEWWMMAFLRIEIRTKPSPGTVLHGSMTEEMAKIDHRHKMRPLHSIEDAQCYIRDSVFHTLTHEAAEHLLFGGDAVFHPHREGAQNDGRGRPVPSV